MNKPKIIAYLKPSCGWSQGVRAIMRKYDLPYEDRDIINDPMQRQEMIEKSGQMLSPCVEINGHMLPDISGDEVEAFMLAKGLVQSVKSRSRFSDEPAACAHEMPQSFAVAVPEIIFVAALCERCANNSGGHRPPPSTSRMEKSARLFYFLEKSAVRSILKSPAGQSSIHCSKDFFRCRRTFFKNHFVLALLNNKLIARAQILPRAAKLSRRNDHPSFSAHRCRHGKTLP